ncbi:MAG: hypothetical protein ACI9VN_000051 [Patescibacteria group bacterium]|jgi:hypothetical protein
MHHLFGIRHHGPGSSRNLLKALEALQPDVLLVEGPADAEGLIPKLATPGLVPPVAFLLYNNKNIQQAAYFPFAVFSPEWQAIQWALKNEVPIRFMDLPYTLQFALDIAKEENKQISFKSPIKKKKYHQDPMSYLAELAGYTDQERWWEVTFEESENSAAIFSAINDLMCSMREQEETPPRDMRREAFMRKTIRETMKKGFENIAVVCGAWHTPALMDLNQYKSTADNALLKGIKKVKTQATIIPWSHERLSTDSGYRSGTISPSWYHYLFLDRETAPIRWMTYAATLLRKKDIPTSSAHIIEAVRLAQTLAVMRGLPLAGIEELKESAVSVFCDGYEAQMELIYKELIYGENIGIVPSSIPVVPLQKDFDAWVKSTRMTKYKNSPTTEWLKATASNPRGGIDLRDSADHKKSLMLHRLNLINIPWGTLQKAPPTNTGRFKEYWQLKWLPDFAIHLIEAGMWGNTMEEAAIAKIRDSLNKALPLPKLSQLIDRALKAELSIVIPDLVKRLQESAALTRDIFHLMDALPSLIHAMRYGSARKLDVTALQTVVDEMIPRICISLPGACTGIDEEVAKKVFDQIISTNRNIHLMENKDLQELWYGALFSLTEISNSHLLLQGASTRILFDRSVKDIDEVITHMYFALSKGAQAMDAANWLQGFLHGSGLLLIHHPPLWRILDEWVDDLPFEQMKELLPLLRRTFSNFPGPERQKMLRLAEQGAGAVLEAEVVEREIEEERSVEVMEVIRLLLGE